MDTSANTVPESKTDQTIAELRQIKIFLYNQSHRTPCKETYDRYQDALDHAIISLGGKAPLEPMCPKCKWTGFKHLHDAAHGIPGTHMSGSERFKCCKCGHNVYAAEGKPLGFIFQLD